MQPAQLAYRVFLEAVKRGLPVEARVAGSNTLLIRTRQGLGVVLVKVTGEGRLVAYTSAVGPMWSVELGVLQGGELAEARVENVPILLSQHPGLLDVYEADIWSKRLTLLEKLKPVSSFPPILAPYLALGGRVFSLEETGDYAAARSDIILAWFNKFTGKLDDATEYLLRAGLLEPQWAVGEKH